MSFPARFAINFFRETLEALVVGTILAPPLLNIHLITAVFIDFVDDIMNSNTGGQID